VPADPRLVAVPKLIADAQRGAGDKAVEAAQAQDHVLAREWVDFSLELTGMLTRAIALTQRQ
jgi:hypothetical protein